MTHTYRRIVISAAAFALGITTASAQTCTAGFRELSGQVLSWNCPQSGPSALNPSISLQVGRGGYGPDWDVINRSRESALRQRILQRQLDDLE